MKKRDILVELLAIKLYEHTISDGLWPPSDAERMLAWPRLDPLDRQMWRDLVIGSDTAEEVSSFDGYAN